MQDRPQDLVRNLIIQPVRSLALLPRRLSLRGSQRVFAVGLSKTGTSSLTEALRILGYRTNHFPIEMVDLRKGRLRLRLDVAAAYECLTDTPVSLFYRQLDLSFPGSKFILTTRGIDGWLNSCKPHFAKPSWGRKIDQLHMELYGCRVFERSSFSRAFERHVSGVFQYFEDRPEDLLVLDIGKGEGWEELCHFLNAPVPDIPFPWVNRTSKPSQTAG